MARRPGGCLAFLGLPQILGGSVGQVANLSYIPINLELGLIPAEMNNTGEQE